MSRLRRDSEHRLVAGVAAGMARTLGVGPWVIRLAFVLASFAGGLGVLGYVVAWLLIPADGDQDSVLEAWLGGRSERDSWLGAALVALAILLLIAGVDAFDSRLVVAAGLGVLGILIYRGAFDGERPSIQPETDPTEAPRRETADHASTALGTDPSIEAGSPSHGDRMSHPTTPAAAAGAVSPPPPAPERSRLGLVTIAATLIVLGGVGLADSFAPGFSASLSTYLAFALGTVGLGLLVGTYFGRSRGLIILGVILVAVLQFAVWFDVPVTGGFGDPTFRPETVAAIQPEYRLAGGEMIIDFSEVADLAGTSSAVESTISLAAGSLRLILPADSAADLDVRVVAGQIVAAGVSRAGTDIRERVVRTGDSEGGAGFALDVDVGFGEVEIVWAGP